MNITAQSFSKLKTQIEHVAVMLAKEDEILISQSIHDQINETDIFAADEHDLCVISPSSELTFFANTCWLQESSNKDEKDGEVNMEPPAEQDNNKDNITASPLVHIRKEPE